MPTASHDSHVILVETRDSWLADALRRALAERGIDHRAGVFAGPPSRVVVTVPAPDLELAREMLGELLGAGRHLGSRSGRSAPPDRVAAGDDEPVRGPAFGAATGGFPWWPVQSLLGVVLVHLALVAAGAIVPEAGRWMIGHGALLAGRTGTEPWRLVTSLVLHGDPAHALWNGVALMVFGVPLLTELGPRRFALIYLTSGVGGAFTALVFAAPGTAVIGSSGAVAGLFGAWFVLALRRSWNEVPVWRSRVRIAGLALLVLPSLLRPENAEGEPISVSSHLGGMGTGVLLGAALAGGLLAHRLGRRDRGESGSPPPPIVPG